MQPKSLNILIHSEFDDLHSALVASALREKGHHVVRSLGVDFPERSAIELHFGGQVEARFWHESNSSLAIDRIDTVWNRRPQPTRVPVSVCAPDAAFAWTQISIARQSLDALAVGAFWANAAHAARQASLKPVQLHWAQGCGLRIPRTLISNEPDAIRRFITAVPEAIYKPLNGFIWRENDVELGSYTAKVRAKDLPSDPVLRATPGIFQARVEKDYEVRAQFFGASCFAVRIESHQIEYGEYDWRKHQHGGAISRAVELPDQVYTACRRLMSALGLVAGGFDFIVTPEGEWVFLEVNEAGQFIFLEMWCPELSVVDACCTFLESRDPNFRYRPTSDPLRLEELSAREDFNATLRAERDERERAAPTRDMDNLAESRATAGT